MFVLLFGVISLMKVEAAAAFSNRRLSRLKIQALRRSARRAGRHSGVDGVRRLSVDRRCARPRLRSISWLPRLAIRSVGAVTLHDHGGAGEKRHDPGRGLVDVLVKPPFWGALRWEAQSD